MSMEYLLLQAHLMISNIIQIHLHWNGRLHSFEILTLNIEKVPREEQLVKQTAFPKFFEWWPILKQFHDSKQ